MPAAIPDEFVPAELKDKALPVAFQPQLPDTPLDKFWLKAAWHTLGVVYYPLGRQLHICGKKLGAILDGSDIAFTAESVSDSTSASRSGSSPPSLLEKIVNQVVSTIAP